MGQPSRQAGLQASDAALVRRHPRRNRDADRHATNLVVSGLLESSDREPLRFFELTPVALPIAVLGLVLLALLGPRLLPARGSGSRRELTELVREFVVDLTVIADGPLDTSTVEDGGLRHLAGVFLVQLERNGDTIAPVSPRTRLKGNDPLRFVGKADDVVDLLAIPGLESGESEVAGFDLSRTSFFEAVARLLVAAARADVEGVPLPQQVSGGRRCDT